MERRKIMYGTNKKDIVEAIKKLREMKSVQLIEGKVCKDHVHMYVAEDECGRGYVILEGEKRSDVF